MCFPAPHHSAALHTSALPPASPCDQTGSHHELYPARSVRGTSVTGGLHFTVTGFLLLSEHSASSVEHHCAFHLRVNSLDDIWRVGESLWNTRFGSLWNTGFGVTLEHKRCVTLEHKTTQKHGTVDKSQFLRDHFGTQNTMFFA